MVCDPINVGWVRPYADVCVRRTAALELDFDAVVLDTAEKAVAFNILVHEEVELEIEELCNFYWSMLPLIFVRVRWCPFRVDFLKTLYQIIYFWPATVRNLVSSKCKEKVGHTEFASSS